MGDNRVLDVQATQAAQEKMAKVLTEFSRWLWKDAGRRAELGALYNETFNNCVTPKYDGSNLTINGGSPGVQSTAAPAQRRAAHNHQRRKHFCLRTEWAPERPMKWLRPP